MSKNQKLLESFTAYCKQYPELRFWQALRVWSEQAFILVASSPDLENGGFRDTKDTYYWEGKDN